MGQFNDISNKVHQVSACNVWYGPIWWHLESGPPLSARNVRYGPMRWHGTGSTKFQPEMFDMDPFGDIRSRFHQRLYVLQRAHINSACHWNSELQANSLALCLLVLSCLIGLELGLWSRQPLPPIWDYWWLAHELQQKSKSSADIGCCTFVLICRCVWLHTKHTHLFKGLLLHWMCPPGATIHKHRLAVSPESILLTRTRRVCIWVVLWRVHALNVWTVGSWFVFWCRAL